MHPNRTTEAAGPFPVPFRSEGSGDEVDVWRVFLSNPRPSLVVLHDLLADDERRRARRFRFDRDRDRYVVARGSLRLILGRYLDADPRTLVFDYESNGKPLLGGRFRGRLDFNLSHSHEVALCAVASGRRIGVDVELIRPQIDAEGIAERFFSAHEVAALRSTPEELRTRAFFDGWTRKEAFIKATGSGLTVPLDGFDVSLSPGAPARLLAVAGDPREASGWRLASIDAGSPYAAALAVEGSELEVVGQEWPPWPDRRSEAPLARPSVFANTRE